MDIFDTCKHKHQSKMLLISEAPTILLARVGGEVHYMIWRAEASPAHISALANEAVKHVERTLEGRLSLPLTALGLTISPHRNPDNGTVWLLESHARPKRGYTGAFVSKCPT